MEQLLQMAGALGAPGAMIFAFLFWRADAERKEMTKLLIEITKEATTAMQDSKASVDMLRVAIGTKPAS